jgi:hypothetical protein
VLNRFLNFTRRQEPQAFPPRKRSMAASCFGQPDPATPELETFIEDALPPGAPLLPGPQQPVATPSEAGHLLPPLRKREAAPIPAARQEAPASGAAPLGGPPGTARFGTPAEDAGLPLEQMRPKIEAGRLIVLGPGGEPVPPYTFAAAAAVRPNALVRLPDGTMAPASRIAAVLGAQVLGRLGEAEQDAGWILAMLRDGASPEAGEQSPEALPPREPDLEPAAAAEQEVDPDSIVLVMMRGVPAGAVLSTGVRDDDGTWLLSPLDLSTVTISLAAQGSGDDVAGGSRGTDSALTVTGIGFAEDGELVAISETVPLADYLADPAGDPAGMQRGA